jgi:antitoxin VapB
MSSYIYSSIYTVKTTRVFQSGNSQAVRIPREFQFDVDEVEVARQGHALVLRPVRRSWDDLVSSLTRFSADFMAEGRRQPPRQKRRRVLR